MTLGPSGKRLLLGLLGGPAAAAALALVASGAVPLRFDLRTLQAQARLDTLGLPRGHDFVVCTADNSIGSAELALFALRHWAFPRGQIVWLVPKEAASGIWAGGFWAVDTAGGFHGYTRSGSGSALGPAAPPPSITAALDRATPVYDTAATRRLFEARLSALRGRASPFVTADAARDTGPMVSTRLGWSWVRWLRLTAVVGVMLLGLAVGWLGLAFGGLSLRILGAATGVVAAFGGLLASAYVVGQALPGQGFLAAPILWLGGTWLAVRRCRSASFTVAVRPLVAAVALGCIAYVGVVVLRLDFDGDTYTTYLPAARCYAWLGRHVPSDPGLTSLVQGAVYPPGMPVFLALPTWIVGQQPDASFSISPESSLAILVYRMLVAALLTASLAALASLAAALRGGSWHLGWAALAAALVYVPVLRGQHTGAETLLLPLFLTGLAATVAGGRRDCPRLAAAGLFTGALATLVKLDGLPFLLTLALPAAWTAGVFRRRLLGPATLALAAGMVPWLVWRISGPASNHAFEWPASTGEALARFMPIGALGLKALIKHELWVPLGVVLPAAVLLRWSRRRAWDEVLPAAGILAMSAAWLGVYTLSTLGVAGHVETSYARIMTGPALAALVFAIEGVTLFSSPAEDGAGMATGVGSSEA